MTDEHLTEKRVGDYAHLDIDQMSSRQLVEYSHAVMNSAVDMLSIFGSGSMPYSDLVRLLSIGALGKSEIAFGLLWANRSNKLEVLEVDNVKTIRLVKKNEQQPEG